MLKLSAWAVLIANVLLTTIPAELRPVLIREPYTEHILAFTSLGVAFATGYRQRTTILLIGLAAFAPMLEAIQLFLPTRHARWQDLLVNLLATCAGIVIVAVAERWRSILHGRIGKRPPATSTGTERQRFSS